MAIYTPYTYLIGWQHLNKFYYGVRYAHGCHPTDLWVTYFTSSKLVEAYRVSNGEPNIIEIRKTFIHKQDAIEWEMKVLRRIRIFQSDRWLNNSIPGLPTHRHMFGGQMQRALAYRRIAEGTHNFVNINKEKIQCPHCGKWGQFAAMKRWHFKNCGYL